MAVIYYGGAAYFGHYGYGTEFLAIYTFGSLHENPRLVDEAVKWMGTFGLEVDVVSLNELKRRLAVGVSEEIAAEAWRERVALRLSREPPGTRLVRAICQRARKYLDRRQRMWRRTLRGAGIRTGHPPSGMARHTQ